MGVISGSNTIRGTLGPLRFAGAPVAGTSEVQTLTFGGTPSGGSFRLGFGGSWTGAIAWSATNATLVANIDAALESLASVGSGGVTTAAGTLTAGVGTITLTFAGRLAKLAVPTVAVQSALTGSSPTLAAAKTTPGITATQRGAAVGAILLDTLHGAEYVNTGSAVVPVWSAV